MSLHVAPVVVAAVDDDGNGESWYHGLTGRPPVPAADAPRRVAVVATVAAGGRGAATVADRAVETVLAAAAARDGRSSRACARD